MQSRLPLGPGKFHIVVLVLHNQLAFMNKTFVISFKISGKLTSIVQDIYRNGTQMRRKIAVFILEDV